MQILCRVRATFFLLLWICLPVAEAQLPVGSPCDDILKFDGFEAVQFKDRWIRIKTPGCSFVNLPPPGKRVLAFYPGDSSRFSVSYRRHKSETWLTPQSGVMPTVPATHWMSFSEPKQPGH